VCFTCTLFLLTTPQLASTLASVSTEIHWCTLFNIMALSSTITSYLVTNIVLVCVETFVVFLRVLARRKTKSSLLADDWIVFVCLFITWGLCAETIYSVYTGLYTPYELMTPDEAIRLEKMLFADILLCSAVYGLLKISLVLFYKRVFAIQRFRLWANVVIVIVILFIITAFLTLILSVHGVVGFWDTPPELQGTQFDMNFGAMILAMTCIDMVLDMVVLSLPLPVISSLHINTRKKIMVSGIFLIGAFCLIASSLRVVYAREIMLNPSEDTHSYNNLLWCHIEAYMSTITTCLPTLAPLLGTLPMLDTFASSIKKFLSNFSISRSRSTISESRDTNHAKYERSDSTDVRKPSWFEMKSSNLTSAVTVGDVEVQSQNSDVIMVKKTFASAEVQ